MVVRCSGPSTRGKAWVFVPPRVTFPRTSVLMTMLMSYARDVSPTATTIRSVPTFWYRESRVEDTFSSTTSAYDPGTRLKPYPTFESVDVVAATAPRPTPTARITMWWFRTGHPA